MGNPHMMTKAAIMRFSQKRLYSKKQNNRAKQLVSSLKNAPQYGGIQQMTKLAIAYVKTISGKHVEKLNKLYGQNFTLRYRREAYPTVSGEAYLTVSGRGIPNRVNKANNRHTLMRGINAVINERGFEKLTASCHHSTHTSKLTCWYLIFYI